MVRVTAGQAAFSYHLEKGVLYDKYQAESRYVIKERKIERAMRKVVIAVSLTALLAFGIAAQKQSKPWSEWSEKDAEKVLNDSAWGQTQTDTNTSEMIYSPTTGTAASGTGARNTRASTPGVRDDQTDRNTNRLKEGAYNQAVGINYRVRFLSAKPIREAFAAMILQRQGSPSAAEQVKTQMAQFVDRDFGNYIVVAVGYDASDQRLSGKAFQDFSGAVFGSLKNNTYLERKDGKRVFLIDYRAPVADGLGAKFVFPRTVGGTPFLKRDSGEVRFYSEVGPNVKLNRRFKVSDMVYQGNLEY